MTRFVRRMHTASSLDSVIKDCRPPIDDRNSGLSDVCLHPVCVHDDWSDAESRKCSLLRRRDCARDSAFLLLPEIEVSIEQSCLRAESGVIECQYYARR